MKRVCGVIAAGAFVRGGAGECGLIPNPDEDRARRIGLACGRGHGSFGPQPPARPQAVSGRPGDDFEAASARNAHPPSRIGFNGAFQPSAGRERGAPLQHRPRRCVSRQAHWEGPVPPGRREP